MHISNCSRNKDNKCHFWTDITKYLLEVSTPCFEHMHTFWCTEGILDCGPMVEHRTCCAQICAS